MSKQDRSKTVMRWDPNCPDLMKCRVCGATHYARTIPHSHGRLCRGTWQCQNGCRLDAVQSIPAAAPREGPDMDDALWTKKDVADFFHCIMPWVEKADRAGFFRPKNIKAATS